MKQHRLSLYYAHGLIIVLICFGLDACHVVHRYAQERTVEASHVARTLKIPPDITGFKRKDYYRIPSVLPTSSMMHTSELPPDWS